MANLSETISYDAGIYQLETTDPVLGGPGGIANSQAQSLANRTAYLKNHVDALEAGTFVPPGIATEIWVTDQLNQRDNKQSVRAATTAAISLTGTQTIDGVALVVGDRVLVKNQTAGQDNGIYVVAASTWSRSADANANAYVTAGMEVFVSEGTANADTIWKLTTNDPITVGTTVLAFADITNGYAPLASPNFSGNPTAPTPAQFDNDTSIATTAFVQQAIGNMSGSTSLAANTTLTLAQAGQYILGTANGIVLTLPNMTGVTAVGQKYTFQCGSGVTTKITIASQNGAFGGSVSGTPTTYDLTANTQVEVVWIGSEWQLFNGSGLVAIGASSGYQKLPSGLIIQWATVTTSLSGDTTVTWPLAFPNAMLSAAAACDASGGLGFFATVTNSTNSQAKVGGWSAYNARIVISAKVIAIGY